MELKSKAKIFITFSEGHSSRLTATAQAFERKLLKAAALAKSELRNENERKNSLA